jgi:uncharacterized protein (DUF1697 family)
LLPGINAGGSGVMKMADLKKRFVSAGLKEVSTYIQSGNVIFISKEKSSRKITDELMQHFKKAGSFRGEIIIFSPGELKTALKNCPFEPEVNKETQKCQIMFLSGKPGQEKIKKLM